MLRADVTLYVPPTMTRAVMARYTERLRQLVESGHIVRVVVV